MRWIFAMIIAFILSAPILGNAQTLNTNGLTKEQIVQINSSVAEMQKENKVNPSKVVREELTEWGKLGSNVGSAMVSAAKEVGVAVDQFARTPIGMLTTGIIVYKIIGKDIVRLFEGFFCFITGLWFCRVILKQEVTVKYSYTPFFFGLWNRRVKSEIDRSMDRSGYVTAAFAVLMVTLAISCAIAFA